MSTTNTQNTHLGNETRVASFEIKHTQFLDHLGASLSPLPEFAKNPEELIKLYRAMVRTRLFDNKAIALQRTGKMGTYASSHGQEAVAIGIGSAMKPEDLLAPVYREHGAQFMRGVAMHELLLYWGGDERGMNFAQQRHDFPDSVPIASQIPHAVGAAYAFKLRKEPRASVGVLGDGATSKGDFYEALNIAGVWQLPVVIVIVNNQWAISLPRHEQSYAATLAQKGIAASVPSEQVDGNDVIAMRYVMERALDRARNGGGPMLIEALTYRISDHTTADDASRYRSPDEVEERRQFDPIIRLKNHLTHHFEWGDADEQALQAEFSAEIEREVKLYLDTPPMPPESMFDHLYETLPSAYKEQRDEVAQRANQRGDKSHD
jgi:2-oxoisovalerate dehydrogenase E1 component alpha subunit